MHLAISYLSCYKPKILKTDWKGKNYIKKTKLTITADISSENTETLKKNVTPFKIWKKKSKPYSKSRKICFK